MQQPAFISDFWLHDDFVACLTPFKRSKLLVWVFNTKVCFRSGIWGLQGGQKGRDVILGPENGQKAVFGSYGELLMPNTQFRHCGIVVMGDGDKLLVRQCSNFCPH